MKTYVLPIPPTPDKSTTDPSLAPKYTTPVLLTEDGAASGLQSLYYGRVLISKSSYTTPNDVYIISGLKTLETEIQQSDEPVAFKGQIQKLTSLTEAALKDKKLSAGEEFWFKGANYIDVQGWVIKPYGWKEGQKKTYPGLLLIHGGPCFRVLVVCSTN